MYILFAKQNLHKIMYNHAKSTKSKFVQMCFVSIEAMAPLLFSMNPSLKSASSVVFCYDFDVDHVSHHSSIENFHFCRQIQKSAFIAVELGLHN